MSRLAVHGEAPQAFWLDHWQVWEVRGVLSRPLFIRAANAREAIQLAEARYAA